MRSEFQRIYIIVHVKAVADVVLLKPRHREAKLLINILGIIILVYIELDPVKAELFCFGL